MKVDKIEGSFSSLEYTNNLAPTGYIFTTATAFNLLMIPHSSVSKINGKYDTRSMT